MYHILHTHMQVHMRTWIELECSKLAPGLDPNLQLQSSEIF
jgi:hypothetical protein